MSKHHLLTYALVVATLTGAGSIASPAPQRSADDLFQEMRWRNIGPFRGGRTKAAAGIPEQPNVSYIGVVDGHP